MSKILIIPAIDIIDGECVRLSQGDYSQKKSYSKDPISVAKSYEDIGIKRLHLVDLDGAKASMPKNLKVVEKISYATGLELQFGGGIKDKDAINSVFNAGVKYAIAGSIAVKKPELFKEWLGTYKDRMILGADIKDGLVATNGWLEASHISIDEIINSFEEEGLSRVICTDISKDGMLQGPNFELYTGLQSTYKDIDITVSGGISSFMDIVKLDKLELRSVIVGKAIYEGHITLKEIEQWSLND